MKKIIIPFFILVAILLIAPFFIGSHMETKVRDIYTDLNKNTDYQFEIIEYSKSWFSSDAKIKITFNSPKNNSPKEDLFTVTLIQQIQHGPLLWKMDTPGLGLADAKFNFELSPKEQSELGEFEGFNQNTIKLTTRMSFDGSIDSHLEAAPFSIKAEDSALEVKAADIKASYSTDGKIISSGSLDGVSLQKNDAGKINISSLSLKSNQELISGDLFSPLAIYQGDFSLKAKSGTVILDELAENFEAKDIFIETSTTIDNSLANVDFKLSIKNFQAKQQDFTNLIYDISLDNLDIESLKEMNKNIVDMQNDPQQMQAQTENPMMALMSIQQFLPKILEKNPIIKINKLGVTTPEGDIDTNLQISIDNKIYNVNNPMTMLGAIDAKANGTAPEAFFTKFGMDAEIEKLIQQNFLIRNQGNLTFAMSFKNGIPLLNGKPMPMIGL